MTTYTIDEAELASLQGKTIIITGAATGIGEAAFKLAIENGANVVIGDWNDVVASKLVKPYEGRAVAKKCDVSKWDDVLELFQEAFLTFGTIHSVLCNAGINTNEGLLDDQIDDQTGRLLPPNLRSIDVNFVGQVYVAKCALHYFKKWPGTRSQLVMTASAGAFFPAPPLHLYCAAKAAALGLMRTLYLEAERQNATVNVVAPWMTVTPMILPEWQQKWKLPMNTARGVGLSLLLPVLRPDLNGKSFFVAGDKYFEFEDSLYDTQPIWMGKELSEHVREGQDILLGRK